MRAKLGWVLVVLAYLAGGLLIVHQHSWWYPSQADLVAAATAVEQKTASLSSPPSLSLLAPEVKELFTLYQRGTYHLPDPLRDFLFERLRSWSDLSPDLRAETAAILQRLAHLDRQQALAYIQRLQAEFGRGKVRTSEGPVSVQ